MNIPESVYLGETGHGQIGLYIAPVGSASLLPPAFGAYIYMSSGHALVPGAEDELALIMFNVPHRFPPKLRSPHSYCIIAATVIAAVSALRILLPRDTGIKPACAASSTSAAEKPPSGPTMPTK